MKFKVGDLVAAKLTGRLYEVLTKYETGTYKLKLINESEIQDTITLFPEDVCYYRRCTDNDIVEAMSRQLREDLILNYSEGL